MDCGVVSCTNSRLFDFIYCHPLALLLMVVSVYIFWVVVFVPVVSVCPTESDCSDLSEKLSHDGDCFPLMLRSPPRPDGWHPGMGDPPKHILMNRNDTSDVCKEISFLDLTSWRTDQKRGFKTGRRPAFL